MALKYHEGFDYQATADDLNRMAEPVSWDVDDTCGFTEGRNSLGQGLETSAAATVTLGEQLATQLIGFAWRLDGDCTLTLGDSSADAAQLVVSFGADSHNVVVKCGDTTLYTSANNVWVTGYWYFIEIWPTISSSAGALKLRIGEGNTLQVSLSGVVTQNTANAFWDTVTFDGSASGGDAPIDDLYWCDTLTDDGPLDCTGFLGDCRTVTEFPAGSDTAEWTPGKDDGIFPTPAPEKKNWQQVSERGADGDASFNSTATIGATDLFNYGTVKNTLDAFVAISTVVTVKRNGNASAEVQSLIKSGDTISYGAAHQPADAGYVSYADMFLTDPATGATPTLSAFNALKAGYMLKA